MRLVDCLMELITFTAYLVESSTVEHPPYEETRNKYRRLLERAEQYRSTAAVCDEDWKEALFAVCAWIDETILCSGWQERNNWQKEQLQRIYFHTVNAGEEFFLRLSKCAQGNKSVREVYDLCLFLGFKGRYFRPDDQAALDQIKSINLELVTENMDKSLPEELFPDAYSSVGHGRKRRIWVRYANMFSAAVFVLPVLAFGVLFYLYQSILNHIIAAYFK